MLATHCSRQLTRCSSSTASAAIRSYSWFSLRSLPRASLFSHQVHPTRILSPAGRPFSVSSRWLNEVTKSPSSPVLPGTETGLKLEVAEPRLSLTFTCTVTDCGTRSTHEFTKRSYEKGIVLVECPGCHNRHLIADHLGWFKESTEEGKLKTVEDLVKAKGEEVRRGRIDAGGVIEYTPE